MYPIFSDLKCVALSCVVCLSIAVDPMSTASAFWFSDKKDSAPVKVAADVPDQQPLTLSQAYALALDRSETLAIHRELIEEAWGRTLSALGVILPSASFVMTQFNQDAISSLGDGSEGVIANASRGSTPLKKFTFSQPLFSGFKEFAVLASGKADRKRQRHLYDHARQMLFINVVDSFYALLESQKDIQILEETKKVLVERGEELDGRVKLGRSRESEVKTSMTDLKLVEAEMAVARRSAVAARILLEFYTGRMIEDGVSGEMDGIERLSDLSYFLSKRDRRCDLKAAEQKLLLSEKKIETERSEFLPRVTLDGNLYTQREGSQSGSDWDTTLTVHVPLFDGAGTVGAVKQATAQKEQERYRLEELRRMAETEIRSRYEIYRSSLEEEDAFYGAMLASEENYKIQSQDYRNSLVNNLEVLDALRRYQEIRRRWNQAHHAAKKSYWLLKVSVGETV